MSIKDATVLKPRNDSHVGHLAREQALDARQEVEGVSCRDGLAASVGRSKREREECHPPMGVALLARACLEDNLAPEHPGVRMETLKDAR
jgi:hypothetical protein